MADVLDLILSKARKIIKSIVNANGNYECIAYKSVTEAFNALYNVKSNKRIKILLCIDSHHSAIAPLCQRMDAFDLKVIELDYDLIPNIRQYLKLVDNTIAYIVLSHMSNVIGILVPIRLYAYVKKANTILIVDGAQAAAHFDVNIKELKCDAYLISSHKLYGAANIGACICTRSFANSLNPLILGGGGVY